MGLLAPSTGLWLSPDNSPTTSTLDAKSCLIDADVSVGCTGPISSRVSVGCDLGSAESIGSAIVRFCSNDYDISATWLATNSDGFEIYTSDNNTIWTLQQQWDAPVLSIDGAKIGHVQLMLTTPVIAQYIKVRAKDYYGWYITPSGESLRVTELEVYSPSPHYEETVEDGFDIKVNFEYEETIEDDFSLHDYLYDMGAMGDLYLDIIEDTFGIDMTEPQPLPPIILSLYLLVDDPVNTQDAVIENPIFALFCFEEFFIWDGIVWSWDHLVTESLINTDALQEVIGEIADEYLLLEAEPISLVKVQHLVNDTVFGFEDGAYETFYLLLADETIEITDGQINSVVDKIVESLGIGEEVSPETVFIRLATESLKFTDIDTLIQEFIIEEGIDLGDVELTRWVFNVLIECGFDITDAFD